MNLRPFEDLIKTIEYDGKTFVPIEVIAKLAIKNYYQRECLIKSLLIVPITDFTTCFAEFIDKHQHILFIVIYNNFDIIVKIPDNANLLINPTKNQVQIVKNLIKWGFVEP